jgi:hypothetical protein
MGVPALFHARPFFMLALPLALSSSYIRGRVVLPRADVAAALTRDSGGL